MSYDLIFWRQRPDDHRAPGDITDIFLSSEEPNASLPSLPTDAIERRVRQVFPELVTSGGLTYWDGGEDGLFEFHVSSQHVHFCCRQLKTTHCNAIIDLMAEFECPLYDPQVDKRFSLNATDE